jgi:hypothetical protein
MDASALDANRARFRQANKLAPQAWRGGIFAGLHNGRHGGLGGRGSSSAGQATPHFRVGLFFSVFPFEAALEFAILIGFAFALRKNPTAHKRLIVIATVGITSPAFFRWHVPVLFHNAFADRDAAYLFLLLLAAYDLWSTNRLHRTTVWGSAFAVLMGQVVIRIVQPAPSWHAFVQWVQTWGV